MATAANAPTQNQNIRIIIEPLNIEGVVLDRGKTSTKNPDELDAKMEYAAKRCPKFVAIKATLVRGTEVIISYYTRAEGAKEWTYTEQFPGTPTLPTTPNNPAKRVKKLKTLKRQKGPSGTTHTATSKGKPGVISAIIELLKGSVDEGGLTVKEIVAELVKRFPSRDGESMEITVRCQLGRIPKQRKLEIGKQKVVGGKEVKYYIATA